MNYLFTQAFVAVPLINTRAVAAQFLVGSGAAVVRVLCAMDAIIVGRAVTPVSPGHVLASGAILRHIAILNWMAFEVQAFFFG